MKTISSADAASVIGVTVDKLKTLEKQGLLEPIFQDGAESFYDPAAIARFKARRDPTLSEQAEMVGLELQQDMSVSIARVRKVLLLAGSGLLVYCLLVVILATLLVIKPLKTAEWLGMIEVQGETAFRAGGKQKSYAIAAGNGRVLAAQIKRGSAFQTILKPVSRVSLGLIKNLYPSSYAEVTKVTILDTNDILKLDANGAIRPERPINIPHSSLLKVDSTELVANLNSEFLQGKLPGTKPGDIAIVGETATPTSQTIAESSSPNPLGSVGTANSNLTNLVNTALTINTTGPLTGGKTVNLGETATISCLTCLTSASATFNGLTIANNGASGLNIAAGKTLSANNELTFSGTDGTTFSFPTSSDEVVGRTTAQTLTGKTISAGSNTILGITNMNLSENAGITNGNLANNSITTAGNSGSGSVPLGGGLIFTGAGISNIVASGSTLTVTTTEDDTLASVTGRGASTSTGLTLNGGVTTTASTALTLDTGTTGGISVGTGANAKTITIGNTTGATAVNINAGTGNVKIEAAGIGTTGNIQVGTGGGGSATPDLLALDVKSTSGDPTGTDGAMYYNANTGKFRCFENSAWANCISSSSATGSDLQTAATYGTNDSLVNIGAAQVTLASVSVTPSTATGDVYIRSRVEVFSSNNTDQSLVLSIEDNTTCTGSTLETNTITITSSNGTIIGNFELADVEVDPGASSQSYSLCASTATGDTDVRLHEMFATVIDTGADLAELYTSSDTTLEPGDVVSYDPDLKTGMKKSVKAYDQNVLGIVATRPGLVIGSVDKEGLKAMPVALSGRVPVKVKVENGPIKAGDYLTSSSTAGVAMKSNWAGSVIGQALSDYDKEGVGLVMAFVKNFDLGIESLLIGDISPRVEVDGSDNGLSSFVGTIQSESPRDPASIIGKKITERKQFLIDFVAARISAIRGYFEEVFAKKVHTDEFCLKKSDGSEVCVDGDQVQNILNNNH